MPLQIWIPRTARQAIYRCQVPGCDKEFKRPEERDQYMRHVVACAKQDTEIDAMTHERESNAFTGILDKEMHGWVRRRQAAGLPIH